MNLCQNAYKRGVGKLNRTFCNGSFGLEIVIAFINGYLALIQIVCYEEVALKIIVIYFASILYPLINEYQMYWEVPWHIDLWEEI